MHKFGSKSQVSPSPAEDTPGRRGAGVCDLWVTHSFHKHRLHPEGHGHRFSYFSQCCCFRLVGTEIGVPSDGLHSWQRQSKVGPRSRFGLWVTSPLSPSLCQFITHNLTSPQKVGTQEGGDVWKFLSVTVVPNDGHSGSLTSEPANHDVCSQMRKSALSCERDTPTFF